MSALCVERSMASIAFLRQDVAIIGTCVGSVWRRCWMSGSHPSMTMFVLWFSRFWTRAFEGNAHGPVVHGGIAKFGSSGIAPSGMPLGDYRWHRRSWARVVSCLFGWKNPSSRSGQRRRVGAIHLRRQFLLVFGVFVGIRYNYNISSFPAFKTFNCTH